MEREAIIMLQTYSRLTKIPPWDQEKAEKRVAGVQQTIDQCMEPQAKAAMTSVDQSTHVCILLHAHLALKISDVEPKMMEGQWDHSIPRMRTCLVPRAPIKIP